MKFLLTSAGIRNASIREALTGLLGKPIAESDALVVPTAMHTLGGPASVWRFITGNAVTPACELGWKSLGVLELTALPSIPEDQWLPAVRSADVLLVAGGDALFLAHWMQRSGLAALLPALEDTVYVGVSGGSMALTPDIGKAFADSYLWTPPGGGHTALGVVDFSIFPHLDHVKFPENSMAEAQRWAATLAGPSYAIDDETALTMVGGEVEVVSEGHWRRFEPAP
jgi:dipeptidase E